MDSKIATRSANVLVITTVLVAMLLPGCATRQTLSSETMASSQHVYEKNYTLKEVKKAYIGEPIITLKDYFVNRHLSPIVYPDKDFTFESVITLSFTGGREYSSIGNVKIDGKSYSVVPSNTKVLLSTPGILVDEYGVVASKYGAIIGPSGEVDVSTSVNAVMTPSDAKMKRAYKEDISKEYAYVNYELIFNGIDDDGFSVTYREYSPEGLARVAFYQSLIYKSDTETIRYKKFKIAVHHFDNESLTYSVQEDPGL